MKSIIVFAFLGLVATYPQKHPKVSIAPTFTVSKERSYDGVPSVSVVFPDGYKDTLVLSKFHANNEDRIANDEHCNYAGHLAKEPEACVAMTGCFGFEDVHFTILSAHTADSSMFKWTKDGNVEIIDSSFKDGLVGESDIIDISRDESIEEKEDKEALINAEANCVGNTCTLPATQHLQIRVGYDDGILEQLGGSSQTIAYIASIWTHLQMNFCHSSLGSKVFIERLPGIKHYSGMNLRADEASLISMYTNTENDLDGADLMLYMGHIVGGGGSGRVADIGVVCKNDVDWLKQSINVYSANISFMGYLLEAPNACSGSPPGPTTQGPTTQGPTNGCGGDLNVESGQLKSPNFPNNYGNNQNCEWVINAGSSIILDFETPFDIEDAPGCGYDYVEVRDGGDDTSTVLKKECGSLPPNTIRSTGNKMYVKFHSDTSDVGKGFSASFKTTITTAQPSTQGPTTQGPNNGCGGELNGESGQLKSPNFPNNYGNNQNCEWVINVPAGSSIILDFETPFDIEDAPGCGYDYVEVRDGGDETSTVLKKECGSLPPNTIQSTDNKMFVKFHSDTSDVGKGFSASFKTTITTAQPSTQGPTNGCEHPDWATDSYCDDGNNNAGCDWDGGACCPPNSIENPNWKGDCSDCKCLDPNAGKRSLDPSSL